MEPNSPSDSMTGNDGIIIGMGYRNSSVRNRSQSQSVHYKSHNDGPETEAWSPRQKNA